MSQEQRPHTAFFVLRIDRGAEVQTPIGQFSLGKKARATKHESTKRWSLDLGRAEIGLGNTMFGISVKTYTGYRHSRPNPLLGGLFRGRFKVAYQTLSFRLESHALFFQVGPCARIAQHVEFQNTLWAILAQKTDS